MSVITITKDNFEEKVLNSDKPVLLDFYADWCGPCMMVSPIIDEIANETDSAIIGKINVDNDPELANVYGVQSIPTLIVVKDGKVAGEAIGLRTKEQILKMLNS